MTGALAPLSYLVVNTRLDRKNLEGTNTLASETKRCGCQSYPSNSFLQRKKISWTVCPSQALSAWPNVCGYGPILEGAPLVDSGLT